MKLSQAQLLAEDAAQAENERLAGMIFVVNLGSHGKKKDIEKWLRKLSRPEQPSTKGVGEFINAFKSGTLFKSGS